MSGREAYRDPLPSTELGWLSVAEKWEAEGQIQNQGVEALASFSNISGSKMTLESFLVLRSIWKIYTIDKFKPSDWSLGNNIDLAENDLSCFPPWNRYIAQIDKQSGAHARLPADNIGAFSTVYYYQTQVHHLKATTIDDSPPKVFHVPRTAANKRATNDSNSSEDGFVGQSKINHPFGDSPLASRGRRPSDVAPSRKEGFSERLAPSGRAKNEDISSVLDQLTLQDSPPRLKGKEKQDETLEQSMSLGSSPLEIVSPLKAFSTPAANDEQIVNTALILFLNATTMFQDSVQADWTPHRRAFHILRLLETRTDGYLRHIRGDCPMAILEVKSHARDLCDSAIQRQESAQMASWISEHPNLGEIWNRNRETWWAKLLLPQISTLAKKGLRRTRLIISQDHEDIYLTFAEYPEAYKAYITGNRDALDKPGHGPFLVMNQYGPWRTSIKRHMEHLGPIILAFTIYQSLYTRA